MTTPNEESNKAAEHRRQWEAERIRIENSKEKQHPDGVKRRRRYRLFASAVQVFGKLLRLHQIQRFGEKIAYDLQIERKTIEYPHLPPKFDGYRILHLSDLHLDRLPGIETILVDKLKQEAFDLVVMTGDYQDRGLWKHSDIIAPMKTLVEGLRTRDGILATLGNHDSLDTVRPLEYLGIRVLCNESIRLERDNESISVTGLDDVHYFYSQATRAALEAPIEGFKILLVHSPEVPTQAAAQNYALYLSGHTHGGQICLPFGIPIFTHITTSRKYASGLWKEKEMVGYTNRGAGVVGLPVRFFCRGEAAIFTLRRT